MKGVINIKSQKGVMLKFLQQNPEKEVLAIDFEPFQLERNNFPFCGAKPGSRLSELKKMGLVEIIGQVPGVMTFQKKCSPSNIYKITDEGKVFKLEDDE